MHGSDNDLRLMYAANKFIPNRIFDTMWAARVLGFTAFGLNDLLSKLIGITLDKGSQKANWTRRPLTDKMKIYALNDSRHLRTLADLLKTELEAKGRWSWHQQICERLIQEHSSDRQLDLDQAWRLKGASKLNRRSLAILRETWHWREREAVKANKPPYFIVRHEDLVRLAETVIDRDTKTIWPHKLSTRRFNSLREAVGQALDLDSENCPEIPRITRRRIKASEKNFYESGLLKLNCDKALQKLHWNALLSFKETVRMTAQWYKFYYESNKKIREITLSQIHEYESLYEK